MFKVIMDLKEESEKKDIDLDEGWKIINLKIKELEDKVRLMQVHMKKLHDKYSLSKPVIVLVTRDENYLGCSEAKDENTSNVSAVHDVTLLYEDDRQIQAHKVILSTCSPDFRINLKPRPMQRHMEKLHGKYSVSQPVNFYVESGDIDLEKFKSKHEKLSYVSTLYNVTLVSEDDRQIQAHKVILSACYPSDLSNIFHENLLKDMLKENISYQSLRINNQVFPVKGPDKTVTPDLFQSQSCVGNCSPPCFLPLLPGGYQDQFFQQEYGQH